MHQSLSSYCLWSVVALDHLVAPFVAAPVCVPIVGSTVHVPVVFDPVSTFRFLS